jgi:ubiquinone/menaquinone biosynthesis C-methylase UbiE
MKMLDIGVGGGRTTYHFAILAKEYVGTDSSQKMIDECTKKFPTNQNKGIFFKLQDVRSMTDFEDRYFDFVLFSFNGIDLMSHSDRLKAFREIRRVCTKDGYFAFSAHNIQALDLKGLETHLSIHPFKMIRMIRDNIRKLVKYFSLRKVIKNKDYAIISGGERGFRIEVYRIRPAEQIRQLTDLSFKNIRVFSLIDGREINNRSELDVVKDDWLYYLCNV